MKKCNEKQRAVIKFFLKQLSWWENTSDIDSPTHMTDIGEESFYLNDHVSAEVIHQLENIAIELYQTIKGIKE